MKTVALVTAAALAFAPALATAADQTAVPAEQTAGLPEAGGIGQSPNLGVSGIAFEQIIIAGIAAFTIAGIVAVAASGDDNNAATTQQ